MQAPLIFSGFPLGYCYPSDPNLFIGQALSLTHAEVPNNVTGILVGDVPPATGDTYKLFYSSVFSRLYEYGEGVWRSKYWCPADEEIKMITEKTPEDILAWDNPGGAVVTPFAEDHTGPFWEIDHAYDGRFVMAPGTFPILLPARTVGLGAVGGLDAVKQDPNQVGIHRHFINIRTEAGATSSLPNELPESGVFSVGGGASLKFEADDGILVGRTREGGGDGDEPSVVFPMDNIPPYRAAYIVKRTQRIWYTL